MSETTPITTTGEEKTWAMIAHVGSFVAAWAALGLICPLIVMAVKPSTGFLRQHCVESLNFQITTLIVVAAGTLLGLLTCGVGFALLPVWGIYYLIVVIMAGVAANDGRDYRYPITLRLVK